MKVKNELQVCPHEPDPRMKCSIPLSSLLPQEKLQGCQKCPTWKRVYEQHQEDVL